VAAVGQTEEQLKASEWIIRLEVSFQSIRTCKSCGDLDGFVKIIDAKQMRFLEFI
jgi:pyruvate/2-oxoglutarate dehydrogenase complex dihydrolipoamide dehydrogenase (E3) component